MTDGERMIWAAAFVYGGMAFNEPVATAAALAAEAVMEARKVLDKAQYPIGLNSAETEMLREMVGQEGEVD